MSQHLSVNGKEYIPSNELASTFGYSSDYIGKLARDEKILGTLIGRQWFVEPESLKTFLLKTEVEKKIRKEELSLQRKAEHLAHQKGLALESSSSLGSVALAQALVIISCGFLLGGLGWVSTEAGLKPADLAYGATESLALIGRSVFPNSAVDINASVSTQLAASTEGLIRQEAEKAEPLVFADLPQFPFREAPDQSGSLSSSTSESVSSGIFSQFSDEVEIVLDEEGNQLLQPIFKDGEKGEERFLIVPVNASEI